MGAGGRSLGAEEEEVEKAAGGQRRTSGRPGKVPGFCLEGGGSQ